MTMTDGQKILLDSKVRQDVYLALVTPEHVINRLALYETSEQKGRHTDAEMSILRYALAGYITGVLSTYDELVEPYIEPYDDQADISVRLDGNDEMLNVIYPAWLADFFSEDVRFEYLKPDNGVNLWSVLEDMRLFVEARGYASPDADAQLSLEADEETSSDAETEATQGPDTGSESADAEDLENDNPGLDIGKIYG